MKKKRKKPMRCPYCGAPVVYRSADGIYQNNKNGAMLYVCSRYPECDAYVRVQPGTAIPLGTLANGDLRALRRETHQYFDKLYTSGRMTKQEAYRWLANFLQAPQSQAHIGYLGSTPAGRFFAPARRCWGEEAPKRHETDSGTAT